MDEKTMKQRVDNFGRAVDVIVVLLKDGKAYISLPPGGSCALKVRDNKARAEVLRSKGLDEKVFAEIVREIPALLYASLVSAEAIYLENRLDRLKQKGGSPEQIEATKTLLGQKLAIVKEKMITEALREREFLSRHVKGHYLVNFEWEAKKKYMDSQEELKRPLSYATAQIWYAGPSTGLEPPWQGPKDFAVDLTEQDIDHLISELTAMKTAIQKMC